MTAAIVSAVDLSFPNLAYLNQINNTHRKIIVPKSLEEDGNLLGFVTYDAQITFIHELSKDNISLINHSDNWYKRLYAPGSTPYDPSSWECKQEFFCNILEDTIPSCQSKCDSSPGCDPFFNQILDYTCHECGLNKSIEMLIDSDNERKAIILFVNAEPRCNTKGGVYAQSTNQLKEVRERMINITKNAYEEHNITTDIIGFGTGAGGFGGGLDIFYENITNQSGGNYSYLYDTNKIGFIFNETLNKILNTTTATFTQRIKNGYMIFIFSNEETTWTYNTSEIVAPLSSKFYQIPPPESSEKLSDHIEDPKYLEVYLCFIIKGKEYCTPMLDKERIAYIGAE
jgi:hypothetical protein